MTHRYSFFANQKIPARMPVPKMVKNGFNSFPRARVTSRSLYYEWKSGTSAKTKRRIKTIFDQFRNRHARVSGPANEELESTMGLSQVSISWRKSHGKTLE